MLRDAAARYVERDYTFEARRAALALPEGFSRERWRAFADMGWLALGLPEDCGGLGDAGDAEVVAHALGRALALEPWLANVGLAAPLLVGLRAGTGPGDGTDRCAALLESLATGERLLAVAAWEPQGRHDAFDVETRARRDADGWRLDGVKTLVLGGGTADVLLVAARESGASRDTGGLGVFEVPADAPGLARHALPTYDGRQTADLRLDGVRLPSTARLGGAGDAWPALERAVDTATALACAEAVGAMQAVLETTRTYLQQRRQFGRPLAANQVLRHRLVDLYADIEQARAIAGAAVARLDDAPDVRRRAVSLAKAFVTPAARRCGEEGIQLHGAIGMTDEVVIGHLARRLVGFANLLGDEAWHLERLAPA
ncbi:MAG: acyl-CoA dehydrogenase [Burkholderiales bacterium]|nr:MAG: acyl-CoA dehydrogenase [Burkholderiales bacterium]